MENFEDVIGYDSLKQELERIVDILNSKEKYGVLGVEIPHNLVLEGLPGVGKTLMANAFIKALNRKSFVLRKDMPERDFTIEIKNVFEEASLKQPAVILLDDMDKFANDDEQHKNSECFVALQSCIDKVKDLDVFVIATANNSLKIPESLLRAGRFDYKFVVSPPKGEDAEKIVKHYIEQKGYVKEIDYKQIAKILYGMSCAELESVINQAGIYAGFAGKKQIEFEDVIKACEHVVYRSSGTMRNYKHEKNKKVSVHEAGHAVVSELLNPESVTLISLDGGDSDVGGFTATFQDDDEYFSDIENMKKRIMVLLGGRAATEIVFGKIDVGAGSDLDRAKQVIKRFVCCYAEFGFEKFEGYDTKFSNDFVRNKEEAIASELSRYYQKTKELLTQNRKFLDEIAEKLLERRVLTGKDVQAIKQEIYEK